MKLATTAAHDDMTLRPSRREGARLAAAVAGKLALGLLGVVPLAEVGAEALVRSPNAGRAPPPARDGELRVEVGPPRAVLSIELVDPPAARATVFVLHGIRDSKESMRGWGRMLAARGYRAVLVDLRGHGRSTGDALTYGVHDARDLAGALDALEARRLLVGPVGVMGNSYGAATAVQWAGRDERVRAVVAVAPFASLRAVVAGYLPVRLPAPLVSRAIELAGARAGFDPDEASPEEAAGRARAAVLLVHGLADARIPAWHSERILAAARARRPPHPAAASAHAELVLVEGAGHDSVAGAPAARLAERAAAWFAAHL